MPVVLRAHRLRFVIFVDDHPPPHIHARGRGEVRIGLEEPFAALTNKGMSARDIARARNAVRRAHEEMLRVWNDLHG